MLTRARQAPSDAALVAAAPATTQTQAALSSTLVGLIVSAAVLFNLILCFADTNVMRMNAAYVVMAEGAILAAAFLLPFVRGKQAPSRMDALLVLLFATWLLLSMLRQGIDPKFFRDVAIIPIFVMLGMACRGDGLHRSLFWLHMAILFFAIWEAVSVESLVQIFAIAEYFENTRGLAAQDWSTEEGLYLSALRPESRFLFEGLPIHRLSSVFLEPVSLGNYVVISTIWLAGFWKQIPAKMRVPAAVATLLLLVGSDSRLATVTCLMLLLALPLRRFLFPYAAALVAPAILATLLLIDWMLDFQPGIDNFEGRLAHAVRTFYAMSAEDYLGLSLAHIGWAQDAGYAYLFMTQSLLVSAILWASLFCRRLVTPEARYVHLAIAVYVALNLTVSWSLFTVKTAALLWVLLGRAVRDDLDAAVPRAEPACPPTAPLAARPERLSTRRIGWIGSSV